MNGKHNIDLKRVYQFMVEAQFDINKPFSALSKAEMIELIEIIIDAYLDKKYNDEIPF
jgi:hypothetical protein